MIFVRVAKSRRRIVATALLTTVATVVALRLFRPSPPSTLPGTVACRRLQTDNRLETNQNDPAVKCLVTTETGAVIAAMKGAFHRLDVAEPPRPTPPFVRRSSWGNDERPLAITDDNGTWRCLFDRDDNPDRRSVQLITFPPNGPSYSRRLIGPDGRDMASHYVPLGLFADDAIATPSNDGRGTRVVLFPLNDARDDELHASATFSRQQTQTDPTVPLAARRYGGRSGYGVAFSDLPHDLSKGRRTRLRDFFPLTDGDEGYAVFDFNGIASDGSYDPIDSFSSLNRLVLDRDGEWPQKSDAKPQWRVEQPSLNYHDDLGFVWAWNRSYVVLRLSDYKRVDSRLDFLFEHQLRRITNAYRLVDAKTMTIVATHEETHYFRGDPRPSWSDATLSSDGSRLYLSSDNGWVSIVDTTAWAIASPNE